MTNRTNVILIFAMLFLVSTLMVAQEIRQKEDGKYYGADNQPYSGIYKEYYQKEQIKTKLSIENGYLHGESYFYFTCGQKNEIRAYNNGEMHGFWKTWNQKGQKVAMAEYKNGLKHGEWKVWDENGTLRYEMRYANGSRAGHWKMFDENGKLTMEQSYDTE